MIVTDNHDNTDKITIVAQSLYMFVYTCYIFAYSDIAKVTQGLVVGGGGAVRVCPQWPSELVLQYLE